MSPLQSAPDRRPDHADEAADDPASGNALVPTTPLSFVALRRRVRAEYQDEPGSRSIRNRFRPSLTTARSDLNHLESGLEERRQLVASGFVYGREKPNSDGCHSTHVGVGIGADQHPDEVDVEVTLS